MFDDDDPVRRGRGYRRSRPFASNPFFRLGDDGLLDRILADVSSWFDDAARGRGPGGVDPDPVADGGTRGDGGTRRGTSDDRAADAVDDYADETRGGPHRGRGPKGYHRSDERVAERVAEALHDDGLVDAREIEVDVADGDVTLSGRVRSRRQKHRAENLAARAAGRADVDNRLRVGQEAAAGGLPGDDARDEEDYGHP